MSGAAYVCPRECVRVTALNAVDNPPCNSTKSKRHRAWKVTTQQAMVRRQDLSGFDDAERYNLRLQMRNRSRLRLFAGSCAIVSLVLVTYVTTEAWFVADWSGKGEGLSELDELSHMAGSSLKGLNTARDLISLKKHGREREELLAQVDRIEAIAQDGTPRASGKRPRKVGPKVETKSVQFSVHIVVEHAAGLDMLMVRGSDGGEWGPVLGTAVTTRVTNPDVAGDGDGNPWNAKKAAAMDDPAVRKAAADALMVQAGLDQPPEIEFMQLLPPRVGSSSDGRASYVALAREAQVSTGGLRGDGSRSARKRIPLDAALKGQTGNAKIDAEKKKAVARSQDTMGSTSRIVTRDAAALRTFLEPWTSTVGKDPKAACKDPRVAAARAAGDEKEAARLYKEWQQTQK